MTKTAPYCKNGLTKNFEKSIKVFDGSWELRDSIADQNERHYMLIKENSSKIIIQGNQRYGSNFTQFSSTTIQDDCGQANIEGESIRFLNSDGQILLSGWFVASESVCIGDFHVYPQQNSSANSTDLAETSIPFLAILSPITAAVQSVVTLTDMIGFSLQSLDIDQYTGKIYLIMQNKTQINLVTLFKNQIILNQQIATCQDPTKCQVLSIHFSALYERIIVSFFEKSSFQLTIAGDMKTYSSYQSAQWVLLLNKDGSYIHNQRIFHSSDSVMSTPKIKFDSIGKLNILLICERNCYLNEDAVSPNVFLLQYDYVNTVYSFVKNFISTTGNFTFTIHSLSVERDLTLTTVISPLNSVSYTIKDVAGRSMQAVNNTVYQYRFRHVDGKIIHILPLTSEVDLTNAFLVSTSSPVVNTNNFIREQNPILYTRTSPITYKTELFVQAYIYYGNRDNEKDYTYISKSPRYGGDSGAGDPTTQKVSRIDILGDGYVYCFKFTYTDGAIKYFNEARCIGRVITAYLDNDEYIKEMSHDYTTFGSAQILLCISFKTNKQTINFLCDNKVKFVEYVPEGLEVIGFGVKSGYCIDSISYMYGYTNTYSCANGYSGDDCSAPVCYDVDSSSKLVCNGNGRCAGPNNCSCMSSSVNTDSHNCASYSFCNDVSSNSVAICSGRGSCHYNGTCSCEKGYYGNECSIEAQCFGIPKSSYGTCSNHGNCLDIDTCECNVGYTGRNCELPICFGKAANTSGICSGHGSCVRPSVCSCKTGYYGPKCEYFYCNGTANASPSVCSSKGGCIDYNKCVCKEGYYGPNCELYNCSGIVYNDPNVCSGNGQCIGVNNCACTTPRSSGQSCEKCDSGYFGSHCEKFTCGNIESTSPTVCSGRGICKSLNTCICENDNINGKLCESCITGYYGEKCTNWTCNGIPSTNSSVCNYRGVCSSYNNCVCNSRSYGTYCNQCIGFYVGQTCGSCAGSHYGDECYNFLESNKAPYLNYQNGFIIITNTNFRFQQGTVDCSRVFENVGDISKVINVVTCKVTEIGLNLDKRSYRYTIEVTIPNNYAIFNPRNPISFNVMWSSTKAPIYQMVNLDISDFLKNEQPYYRGVYFQVTNGVASGKTINRCFETKIKAYYSQPEFGTFQSLTWNLTGNSVSLMKNKLVSDAIQNAQNKLEWTFPYIPELSHFGYIELSVSVVTNFGLKYTSSDALSVSGSYRKTPYYFPRTTFLLTSNELTIPLSQYFSENLECIDGRTISYTISKHFKILDSYFSLEFTEKDIVFKAKTTSMYMFITIQMIDGTQILLNFNFKPPTVSIKETVVVYKESSVPTLTLSCKYYYGRDQISIPQMMLIMENNQVYKRIMMAQTDETVSLQVNQLYPWFDLTIPHTFTVACLRSTDYALSDLSSLSRVITNYNSILPVVGITTQTVSFISETINDYSSCKVLGASLIGLKSNTIPFPEIWTTYFLEILTTQAPNCQVDISYINSQNEKYMLDNVSVSGSKYVLPLQFLERKLKSRLTTISNLYNYFTLSLKGSNDLVEKTTNLIVQDSLSSIVNVADCTISPSKIEIGFTLAKLSCSISPPSTYLMTLYHEDSIVATSYSSPISFKFSKSGKNFKLQFLDEKTGGQTTLPITLMNQIEFSTSSLFTDELVSSISSSLANSSSDYFKNNDLVISMVSNFNSLSSNNSIVMGEIQRIIPAALAATTSSVSTQLDVNLAQGSVTSEAISKYINQVKILSKPEFLTKESTMSTVDMINKFVDISSKAAVWSSDSSNSLSEILVNVAANIPESSTIKLASSIVNAAISLGTKAELTTLDFFPGEKPSNLVSINAVKTSVAFLNSNSFSFSNSNSSLVSFSVSTVSTIQMVNIANSLFKFPTKLSRKVEDVKKEYISQLTISNSLTGSVHINIPIPSYIAPISSRTNQTFRCSLTLDFTNFETESSCKFIKTSFQLLTDIKASEQTLIVHCLCDLSSLSNLMNNSMVGITADYLEQTLPLPEKSTTQNSDNNNNGNNDNNNNNSNGNSNDSSAAAAVVILIPVLLCCVCFITIPIVVGFIIVREKRKQQQNTPNVAPPMPANTRPQYDRVMTNSTNSSGSPFDQFGRVNSNFNQPSSNNIAMTTYSETNLGHKPTTI
ncbi:predicted protein [Naegleria gruberi]|uniref:Predicted protein n=1 Tax=Naegleria gruberi TaxID=5762 RepID=D2VXS7_NAEGR|nr:uncharacterized protein NAEGRDRAFT_73856 [Naegleria gruberi]EFC38343.1 predicted protein [Naegleria gruberi]|eukprot:XP_002671087.1 predicted protein [Naegleria gruberi strain NEG-M]